MSNRCLRFSLAALGLWCISSLAGCWDKGPERAVIAGSVSYRGESVKEGKIFFVPAQGTKAPVASAMIRDGKYRVDRNGGAVVGDYTVKITAYRETPEQARRAAAGVRSGSPDGAMPHQFLPAKFNQQTELKATIPSGSGQVTQNFQLN
jgi:hypothetical protein